LRQKLESKESCDDKESINELVALVRDIVKRKREDDEEIDMDEEYDVETDMD